MFNFSLRVDFPALDGLLAYLRERDATQAQIDAITAAIAALTQRLQTANARLEAAKSQQPR